MKLENLRKHIIEDAIEDFYKTINKHVDRLVRIVANETYGILRAPRRHGIKEYEFFFAADLDKMFQFALGELKASPSYIKGVCNSVVTALTTNPQKQVVPMDWQEFGSTPLGLGVQAALARLTLRESEEDQMISAEEVSVLSSIPLKDLAEELELKKGKSTKQGALSFRISDVKKAFQKENIPV